ncbi:MAG: EcsC family protein [Rhodobacteraceae bacterium]|nr:EcsC family protein [Paracoccaceae bacterium]
MTTKTDETGVLADALPAPMMASGSRLPPDALVTISSLAIRAQRANGPVMSTMNRLGRRIEGRMTGLPVPVQRVIDQGMADLLTRTYRLAGRVGAHPAVPAAGPWGHRVAAVVGGAVGGFGGIGTALVELPLSVAVIFAAMQRAAAAHNFDPADAETRLECLTIFGAGGPTRHDDGMNSGFIGARLAVSGSTLQAVIGRIAPDVAAMLGRKLAAQTAPVLGAATGAGINLAFMRYYEDMATVHFGLKRLSESHGQDEVLAQFRRTVKRLR